MRKPKQDRKQKTNSSDQRAERDHRDEQSDEVEGEGSYTASKQYGDSVQDFVESGKVEQASQDARPRSEAEARELQRAEEIGRSRAKEDDPEVSQPHSNTQSDATGGSETEQRRSDAEKGR